MDKMPFISKDYSTLFTWPHLRFLALVLIQNEPRVGLVYFEHLGILILVGKCVLIDTQLTVRLDPPPSLLFPCPHRLYDV